MPRHHFNQLRFAWIINDKSRYILKLLQFYNIFEFRYEIRKSKAVPRRHEKCLFRDCFLFVCRFCQNVFFGIQTNFKGFSFFGKPLLSDQQTPTPAVPATCHTEYTGKGPDASSLRGCSGCRGDFLRIRWG